MIQEVTDASAACKTRVYSMAFQSLQLGLSSASVMSSYLTNQRYSHTQLQGKSIFILIHNGTSELGRAWIQLSHALGATHIFATGSTPEELSILRDELNVTPLGSDSFSWALDIGEKLNVILIQEFPSCYEFDMYFSVLNYPTRGVLVYSSRDDGGEEGKSEENETFDLAIGGCSGGGSDNIMMPSFQDLANKARDVVALTTFSLRLTSYCSRRTSRVEECILPEDIPSFQDRIELEKKRGTLVCLPAPLYENKAVNVVSPFIQFSRR